MARSILRWCCAAVLVLVMRPAVASAATLMIAWDPSSWATGYVVSFGTQTGVYTTQIDVGNQTRFQLNGLTTGAVYFISVSAYNPAGMSGGSAEVSGVAAANTNPFGLPDSPDEGSVAGVATAVGADVAVVPVNDFIVRFTKVTAAGKTSVQVIDSSMASGLAPGVNYGDWIYRVTTTAKFSGPVTVGVAYGSFEPQSQGAIRLYGRTDISAWTDLSGHIIWGSNANLADSFYLLESKPTITSVTYSPAPVTAGSTIKVTAAADGSGGALNYRFWRRDGTGAYTIVQDYGPNNTYTWASSPADAGTHGISVWVRRADSTADYDVWSAMSLPVAAIQPLRITGVAPNEPLPAPVGRTLTLTAASSGGLGPILYRFWRLDNGVWSMVQDYGTSKVYTWTPTDGDVGPHTLSVWAKSSNSTTATYDTWLSGSFSVSAAAPVKAASLTANVTLPTPAGTSITFTAKAAGGTDPLQYAFWRFDEDTGWNVVQGYTTSNTYTWATGGGDTGTHAVSVWIRNAGSTAMYDTWIATANFTVTAPPSPRVLSLRSNVPLPAQAGSWVTWTATAVSTGGPLEYRFWRFDTATGWTIVQDYSSDNSYTWPTESTDVGTHQLSVWVRRVGVTADYEAWAATGAFVLK